MQKYTFFTFFLITIRFFSQKCYIFAPCFQKRCKISINFLIVQIMVKEKYHPNHIGWKPNENDYVLVFMMVDCFWKEVGHDIPKYRDILLADYLNEIGLVVPDYTQFLRVIGPDYCIVYRAYDCMRITIHFQKNV